MTNVGRDFSRRGKGEDAEERFLYPERSYLGAREIPLQLSRATPALRY